MWFWIAVWLAGNVALMVAGVAFYEAEGWWLRRCERRARVDTL